MGVLKLKKLLSKLRELLELGCKLLGHSRNQKFNLMNCWQNNVLLFIQAVEYKLKMKVNFGKLFEFTKYMKHMRN